MSTSWVTRPFYDHLTIGSKSSKSRNPDLILRSTAFKCWQERKEEFPLQSSKLRRVHEFGASENDPGEAETARISWIWNTWICVNPKYPIFSASIPKVPMSISLIRCFLFHSPSHFWVPGPWLNTTYLPMWQKRPSGAIWMPHHNAVVGKPDIASLGTGDLIWNLASLLMFQGHLVELICRFCHGDISQLICPRNSQNSWCFCCTFRHETSTSSGGVHSLEFHQDTPSRRIADNPKPFSGKTQFRFWVISIKSSLLLSNPHCCYLLLVVSNLQLLVICFRFQLLKSSKYCWSCLLWGRLSEPSAELLQKTYARCQNSKFLDSAWRH